MHDSSNDLKIADLMNVLSLDNPPEVVEALPQPPEPSEPASPQVDFQLESIFNSSFLSTLTSKDLELSVKDLIIREKLKTIKPNWIKSDIGHSKEFKFNNKQLLDLFLINSFTYSLSVEKTDDENSIKLTIKDEEFLAQADSLYAKCLALGKGQPEIKLDHSEADDFKYSFHGEVAAQIATEKNFLLKIPVAKVGKWKHPRYGEVKYTSEDLDVILRNFTNNELGFEVPIYFGHSNGDGKPAEGYLFKLERSDDFLFGYWKVNKLAYRMVEDERYRYSSAELSPDLTSKKTGDKLGKTLFGMALTNIPFIPNLPKNQALSALDAIDDKLIHLSINNNFNMPTPDTKQPLALEKALKDHLELYTAKIQEVEAKKHEQQLSQLTTQVESFTQKEEEYLSLEQKSLETEQKLSQALTEKQELETKLAEYTKQAKQQQVQDKLNQLEKLALPTEFKQVYSNFIKEGTLGDTEDTIIASFAELAKAYSAPMLEQNGTAQHTDNLNDEDFEDPYQKEIERVKSLIAKRNS